MLTRLVPLSINTDYGTAANAAQDCMDLEVYDLAPDYGELFRDKTRGSKEVIFSVAHSSDLELDENGKPTTQAIGSFIARSAGGTHNAQPSWELLAVYEMTNGKTIDEPGSGFDPHDPFANRDPRCLETFAAPGSRIYGIEWNPAPNALEIMDYTQNRMITNKDSKGGSDASNCAYNGCCLRKGAQESWRTTLYNDNPVILMRYADVLLMYAEAKIELGEIDATVLACINDVRARAYGTTRTQTNDYPSITTTDQTALRKVLRRERRVEFAWENLRYFDLLRWHQFENAFGHNMYGLPVQPTGQRNTLRQATGFGRRLRHLTKTDFLLLKRWPTEPISSSMVNVSMMRRFIYGHCQVMMY